MSPHLDDAVLSLAATIFRATRAGSYVRIVTVFSGDAESDRPASGWDSLSRFATEGEATRRRREEDAEACSVVGADRRYLDFSEPVYAGFPEPAAIVAEVNESVSDVDAVLVAGFPLIHRDHRWLTEQLLSGGLECARVGLYIEQPYRHQKMRYHRVRLDPHIRSLVGGEVRWRHGGAHRHALRAKRGAVAAYATQLRWLELDGRKLDRMLMLEALRGGETVGWLVSDKSDARG